MAVNKAKCQQVIQDGLTRNNASLVGRLYALNTIPALPGIRPRDAAYWSALASKYPADDNYFTGNIRKLQLKVVEKLSDHIQVVYDKTDETGVVGIFRLCTDAACFNIKHINKSLGSEKNKGRLREFMGRHNIMIALLTSDDGNRIRNPLGDEGGGVHAVTICRVIDPTNPGKETYSVYDSTGYYGGCSIGFKNLLNFAGNDISRKVTYQQVQEMLEVERDPETIRRVRHILENYEDYLFNDTNIYPIKCTLQTSRPTCVFWSILRALHPEKTLEETQCILSAALEKSGLTRPDLIGIIGEEEKLDLLILHLFEEFIDINEERTVEQRRINRWVLGGRRTLKKKTRRNRSKHN